ncbi:hypothetical protein AB835_03240 [Candidatus Endobugula sertula]|uniref:Peptidase A2 domain-containing protein n=1 Tax=Candidatus Endobugula sertula TaxID=62101 RepID=A0A1D2QSB1_9GAMM|nr:hypothetical protein AB835_03240 [Candidatus Endobugula sertula]
MKLITFICALILCFGIGYYTGHQGQNATNQGSHTISQHHESNPPITDTMSPLPAGSTTCNCSTLSELPVTAYKLNRTQTPIPAIFSQLLEAEKYIDAMRLYHTIWNLSQDNAHLFKQQFIQYLKRLIEFPLQNREKVIAAIDSYLNDFYDDIDILLILADFYDKQELFYEALNTFQLVNSYAFTKEDKIKTHEAYKQFMKQVNEAFMNSENLSELINIYTFADNTGLLTKTDRYQLINIHLQSGNEYRAKAEADNLAEHHEWRDRISALFKTYGISSSSHAENTGNNSTFESSVTLIKHANQFIVPVNLSGTDAQLLLDTGASITTISKVFFETMNSSSNMTYQSSQYFLTANGKTNGDIYLLDTFTLGNYTISNVSIAVLDYPTSNHSVGLLGMNILQQFQFEIDQKNSLINLRREH